jgi:hypothetical protein
MNKFMRIVTPALGFFVSSQAWGLDQSWTAEQCVAEINNLLSPTGELSKHDPEYAELTKALKQVTEDFKTDRQHLREWTEAFEKNNCDPYLKKPGSVWNAACADALKSIVTINSALQQDQALFTKVSGQYADYVKNHFERLDKHVGNLKGACSFAKFGTGPAAEPATKASGETAKTDEKQGDDNGTAGSKTDDHEQSDVDSDNTDEVTAEDEPDDLQLPTDEETEAAFPDPEDAQAPAADGIEEPTDDAGGDNGLAASQSDTAEPPVDQGNSEDTGQNSDDDDLAAVCAANPNCQMMN